jgi:RNA polymerase sigma factor (sigma-70 family)
MPTRPNAAPLAGLALRCQPDSRLARLSHEGQPRAFEEIVRRYRQPLVSFAGTIVSADRAEDVVQEALAKAHAALVASESEVRLKPWLYAIVRNRALNDLRDEPTHELLDDSFDGVTQPPEVVAGRERLAGLVAQLRGLPQAQREALIQRELEGRSHREIGDTLGVTPGAVRGLIFRARAALRDAAGMLIPVPVLRALLNAGPFGAEAAGAGVGSAAAGLTAGGGGGAAVKAGATLAVAVLAVGSGAAIQNRGDSGSDRGATTFASTDRGDASQGGGEGARSSGQSGHGSGSSSGPGPGDDSRHGSGDSSGPGGGHGSGDDDRDEADGHEGPGGGGDSGHEGSGSDSSGSESSGSGSDDSDSSGSGSGSGSSGSGSGSGSSGSGSSGSGGDDSENSGSGTSGSGSSASGSSGSGSSGSGSSGSGSSGSG